MKEKALTVAKEIERNSNKIEYVPMLPFIVSRTEKFAVRRIPSKKVTEYQLFVSEMRKKGYSMKEIAEMWKKRKEK